MFFRVYICPTCANQIIILFPQTRYPAQKAIQQTFESVPFLSCLSDSANRLAMVQCMSRSDLISNLVPCLPAEHCEQVN